MPLAIYKCVKCGYSWEQYPEPGTCLSCGNLYVEWVNYEEVDWIGDKYEAL